MRPLLYAALLCAACRPGMIDGPMPTGGGEGGGGEGGGGEGGGGDPMACSGPSVAPMPLPRLRRVDYDHTVSDLFGDAGTWTTGFPPEERALGFDNQSAVLSFSQLLGEAYMNAAEVLTKDLTLRNTAHCLAGNDACVRTFIETFGARVFRRPLETTEVDTYFSLFTSVRAAETNDIAVQVTVQALLQSPQFLYRLELKRDGETSGQVVALDGYEVATRLSYAFWNTMPDDVLLTAAANGELATVEQVEAQARRLLADPRAKDRVDDFFSQWLDLQALPTTFRSDAPFGRVRGWLDDETRLFTSDVFWNGKSTDLFTATYGYGNSATALLYTGMATGGVQFQRIEMDPAQRPGVFTRSAFLSIHAKQAESSPLKRGKFIRERVLCMQMPDPPPGIPQLPDLMPDQTTREHFDAHTASPQCSSCHRLMDPIGFGLENFDAIGKWRTTQNGKPIDASGEIVASPGAEGTFNGPVELMQKLSAADPVQLCMVRQVFRYQLGRVDESADLCARTSVFDKFKSTGFDLEELMVALATSDAFRFRKAP